MPCAVQQNTAAIRRAMNEAFISKLPSCINQQYALDTAGCV
jgi:hypothetical protein